MSVLKKAGLGCYWYSQYWLFSEWFTIQMLFVVVAKYGVKFSVLKNLHCVWNLPDCSKTHETVCYIWSVGTQALFLFFFFLCGHSFLDHKRLSLFLLIFWKEVNLSDNSIFNVLICKYLMFLYLLLIQKSVFVHTPG